MYCKDCGNFWEECSCDETQERSVSAVERLVIHYGDDMKRRKIFEYILRDLAKLPEAQILPTWAKTLHWFLFPLISLRYWNDDYNGYNVMNDTWNIHGIKFTGSTFYRLGKPGKKLEVLKIENGVLTLREIE